MNEYEKLRKTANRRLRRLRESGQKYPDQTFNYLVDSGRRTFTKSGNGDMERALREVKSFLNNPRSTLSGIKKAVGNDSVKGIGKEFSKILPPEIVKEEGDLYKRETEKKYAKKTNNGVRYEWKNLSPKEKIEVYERYRKTANRRLRRLRESGANIPYLTDDYLKRIKRRNFKKLDNDSFITEINAAIIAVESFLDIETSTLSGIRKVTDRIKKAVAKYEKDQTGKSNNSVVDVNDMQLLNFLHSRLYKQLRSRIDSDKIIRDFAEFEENATYDEIMSDYEKYLNYEISYADVEKRFSGNG